MSRAERSALLQTAYRAGTPFRSMCLSGHRKYPLGSMDDAVCRRGLEIMKETAPGKFREIPFGTGHVDFERMIDAAWELGVRRYVTEMWYVGQAQWREDIRFAHDKMAGLLDRNTFS